MSFFKRLLDLFAGGKGGGGENLFPVYVLSHRCQEPIHAQIDLRNSLSQSDDEDRLYFTRKVLQGSGAKRCFTSVEVSLWFDGNRNLVRHEVTGGRWLSPEEYDEELARFHAPEPEEEPGAGEESEAEAEERETRD
jgi:hypothetical protein